MQSITGKPATVHHAVATTMPTRSSTTTVCSLDVPSKLKANCMDDRNREIFWQFDGDERPRLSRGARTRVPSREEIKENIAARRRRHAARRWWR